MGERVLSDAELAEIERREAKSRTDWVASGPSYSRTSAEHDRGDLLRHIRATEAQAAAARPAEVQDLIKRLRQDSDDCMDNYTISQDLLKAADMLAALQPPRDGWRSMDSAPRDGTRVLLWCGDADFVVAYWEQYCSTGWKPVCGGDPVRDWFDPQAWQPLPSPPAAMLQAAPKSEG